MKGVLSSQCLFYQTVAREPGLELHDGEVGYLFAVGYPSQCHASSMFAVHFSKYVKLNIRKYSPS